MAPDTGGSRIVRTWPGRNTGDSYTLTADGRVWHTHHGGELGTGESLGRARNGVMEPVLETPRRRVPEPREPNRAERRAATGKNKPPGRRRW